MLALVLAAAALRVAGDAVLHGRAGARPRLLPPVEEAQAAALAPAGAARRAGRARRWGGYALLAVPILVLAGLAVAPRVAGFHTLTVLSGSMRPWMNPGDLAVVKPEPVGSVRAGQVLTFIEPDGKRVVTHRVIRVERRAGATLVRTRGDANDTTDPWRAQLHGRVAWRVVHVVRWAGWPINWLRRSWLHVATTMIAPALFAILTLLEIWRGPRRRLEAAVPIGAAVVGLAVFGGLAKPTRAEAAWRAVVASSHSVATPTLTAPTQTLVTSACDPLRHVYVDVTWTPSTASATNGYAIARRVAGTTTWTTIGTVSGRLTSTYRDGTAAFLTRYDYRVTATRGAWSSAPSPVGTLTTLGSACL